MTDTGGAAWADAMIEAGNDCIRASNTLMLMLVGDLALTKPSLESAIRRMLDARLAWDNCLAARTSGTGVGE